MGEPSFAAMAAGYDNLWKSCAPLARKSAEIDDAAARISSYMSRYKAVSDKTGVPWWWIGCTHYREASCRFSGHLHNGDPLTARTYHVPKGRPLAGNPPFAWEDSAIDALTMRVLDRVADWSIPRALFEWEGYNGWGYRSHNVNSPYVWAATSHQENGKYVADGVWSPTAFDTQLGCAAILHRLIETGVVNGSAPTPQAKPKPADKPAAPSYPDPKPYPLIVHAAMWLAKLFGKK